MHVAPKAMRPASNVVLQVQNMETGDLITMKPREFFSALEHGGYDLHGEKIMLKLKDFPPDGHLGDIMARHMQVGSRRAFIRVFVAHGFICEAQRQR